MKFNGKSTWRRMSLSLLILSAASACVHGSTPPPVANSYCAITKPIRYNSQTDSPETVKRIEAHNSTWVCLCEQDCPASGSDTK